jgi:hypothetical protein
MMVDGDICMTMNSGKPLRKWTARFASPQAPLDPRLLLDDKELEVLLPRHSIGPEVVSTDGTMMNSGDELWLNVGVREN